MNTTVWNCQDLSIDLTVQRLKEIKRKYLPDMVCLLEIKQKDDFIRDRCSELGYDHCVTVPPRGMSGGIAIFWKKLVSVLVIFSSPSLVDCLVDFNGISFYLSFVYGPPIRSDRNYMWERLERISIIRAAPWLVMGDFNEIRGNDEKQGGPLRAESTFTDFRRMINTCEFHDVKSIGNRFVWYGKRYNHDVRCCLDRVMANSEWITLFP